MNWISKITDTISTVFSSVKQPLIDVPAILLFPETKLRSGVSAISLTSNIISRLGEAGIETGVNVDGSENKTNAFVRIIVEEVLKEIQNNARIDLVVPPNSLIITGTGAGPTGPVQVTATNILPSLAYGVLR